MCCENGMFFTFSDQFKRQIMAPLLLKGIPQTIRLIEAFKKPTDYLKIASQLSLNKAVFLSS